MVTRMQTAPAPPPQSNGGRRTFTYSRGVARKAHRVLIYGTGGIGKTSFASGFPSPVFVDVEGGSEDLDVRRVDHVKNWASLKSWLQTGDFIGAETIVIDTTTGAEEWCRQYVIENVKHEKGNVITGLESYGYGKGYTHLFEEWKRLLGDLDRHYTAGINIGLIAHERIGKVPNPSGDDYIRYEPRLQSSDKSSIMYATKEWCDHVLFISYDVAAKDGKAKGSGTRTIYTAETATYMAKSRTLPPDPFVFELGKNDLWARLNNKHNQTPGGDLPPA
jgi:hypothetical protein